MQSDAPLSIVVGTPYFQPAWKYGGPPVTTYQTAAGLAERRHRVRVVTSAFGVPKGFPRDRWLQSDDEFEV